MRSEYRFTYRIMWGLSSFEEFQEEEGVSLRCRAGWFWSPLTTAAHQTTGEIEHGSKVAVHESVCVFVCVHAPCQNLQFILSHVQTALKFPPKWHHSTSLHRKQPVLLIAVWYFCSLLLQFGNKGWTDLLSRATFLSVFHLRDQKTSDEVFFPPKNEKSASGNTCHTFEI